MTMVALLCCLLHYTFTRTVSVLYVYCIVLGIGSKKVFCFEIHFDMLLVQIFYTVNPLQTIICIPFEEIRLKSNISMIQRL